MMWIAGLVAFVLVAMALGAIYESVAEAADARAYPPPGRLVDVGGYRLHLNCSGTGSPTVVIEAGLGDFSTRWSRVQPEVAKTTRVCTYDRAGYGWSDAGPQPRTAQQFATELHMLLTRAQEPGPFVLVGHSSGGLTVRVFAHEYAAEVAGVVLIESMSPRRGAPAATDVSTPARSPIEALIPVVARLGILRLTGGPLGIIPRMPSDTERANFALSVRPLLVQTYLDEFRGIDAGMAQAAQVQSLGDVPLIVLTGGIANPSDPNWPEKQADLLLLSTQSQQLFASQSGHNVHFEEPQAAVDAILKMVGLLRQP
jgi:pimeloyl-ACP methyl ester carboxylesterase